MAAQRQDENQDWPEYRRLVMDSLTRIEQSQRENAENNHQMRQELESQIRGLTHKINTLNVFRGQMMLLGAIAGLIATLFVEVISWALGRRG